MNLANAVTGSTTGSLYLSQSATGGAGGQGLCSSGCGTGGAGGNAVSTLIVNDSSARSLSGTVKQLAVLVALLFIFNREVPQLEVPAATQWPLLHWRPL